jgi:hypothetical protein
MSSLSVKHFPHFNDFIENESLLTFKKNIKSPLRNFTVQMVYRFSSGLESMSEDSCCNITSVEKSSVTRSGEFSPFGVIVIVGQFF